MAIPPQLRLHIDVPTSFVSVDDVVIPVISAMLHITTTVAVIAAINVEAYGSVSTVKVAMVFLVVF